jgi:aminoglycoside phosphotransferase (APT) family kinase protein
MMRPTRRRCVPDASDEHRIGALLGRGRVADVHEYGGRALKLYHLGQPKTQAFVEATILAVIEAHQLPAPRVHAAGTWDGRWGLVMDRVAGTTLGERALADPGAIGPALDAMVRLQLRLHAASEPRLRSLKSKLGDNIARAGSATPALKDRLLARLDAMPDGSRVCHGDFHPFNILGEGDKLTIVDWLDATSGPPAADTCRSYLLLRMGAPAGFADAYLDSYASAGGMARDTILDWLPLLAAARLAEGIEAEVPALLEMAGTA